MELIDIYKRLKTRDLCLNAYEFSQQYLGRAPNYFSVLKAKKRQASTQVLLNLYFALRERSEAIRDPSIPCLESRSKELITLSNSVFVTLESRYKVKKEST